MDQPLFRLDYSGGWTITNDSIRFHETRRIETTDSGTDTLLVDQTYTWRYHIVEGTTQADDLLHVWIFEDPNYYQAAFPRTN